MKFHLSKISWAIRALIYKPFTGKMGLPSYFGKPIFISDLRKMIFGKRVRIFPHARIEAIDNGSIIIEDNVYIGQNCHITSSGSPLIIRKGSAVMANVCITNIDHMYVDMEKPILEQGYSLRETILGEQCFVGYGAVIQAGVKLGNHVIVGANAVVMRGIYPNNCVLVGSPARIKKRYVDGEWKNEN